MKSKSKEGMTSVRLPHIVKTADGLKPVNQQSRPASSGNKIQDLEKKLFSKIDAYEAHKKKSNKKYIVIESCKEIAEAFDKTVVYPDPISKNALSVLAKANELKKPLQKQESNLEQTVLTESNDDNATFVTGTTITDNLESSAPTVDSPIQNDINNRQSKLKKKKVPIEDSFTVAEKEMERIYSEYLEAEGLPPDSSAEDLSELSKQIEECDKNIQGLQRSYSALIRQINEDCLSTL